MTAPWEEYQAQTTAEPWKDYQQTDKPSPKKDAPISRLAKIGQGLRDPIDGGAQLLTNLLPAGLVNAGNAANNWLADKTGLVGRLPEGGVDQQVREKERDYQSSRTASGESGFDGYRVLGNVFNPANIALASRLPAAATLAGRVGVGALGGAASGALNPVVGSDDFALDKAKQIGAGAAFGGLVPAITGGISRVISPRASLDPNVQLLRGEGVNTTIGQSLGGFFNRAEEKAMSVPILGDAISSARETARRQFNEAAINRATSPIGMKSQGAGNGAVQRAGDEIGAAYDAARSSMGAFQIDQQGSQEINRIRGMVQNLPPTQKRTFEAAWQSVSTDISPNGTIPANVFKRIDSKLGQEAAQFSGSQDPYHQQLGSALGSLRDSIAGAGRRANPQADEMFTAADRAYANLVRVEGAAKSAMNTEGVFTPGQLNSAIRMTDQSVRKRATARGEALMQDLGSAGQTVLGNKVPNSATADRLMLGAGGLGAGLLNPAIPIGLLGGAAMYTSPMQRLLSGSVAARPQSAQAIAEALRKASPGLIPGGAQVGLGLLDY